ncbi:hypothetical protein PMAYCL1PPCAC_08167, partial [Pristionchus mayeri]
MLSNHDHISSLEYSYRSTLTNIVVANLLFSVVFILVQEPAAYGLFPEFYRSQSPWLGKVQVMQAVPLTLATGIFHVIIAINRVRALTHPLGHTKVFSQICVRRIIISVWAVTILECVPLIYPFKCSYYKFVSPIRTEGIGLVVLGVLPNLIYQGIAMGVGGLLEVIAISLYLFIGLRINKLKKLPKSVTSATVSAVLISTGGFAIVLVVLPDILAARIFGKAIWSDEMFYGLFKLANAYNNAVTPWVMFTYYKNVRN